MAKIVVVEDNPYNMKLTVFLLNSAGHQVLQAVDAEVGLALISETLPDLILMDMQLPGMDGLAATQLLKSNPERAHIPVIALTAHAMNGDEVAILEAGCDGYLPKPFHHKELFELINKTLK